MPDPVASSAATRRPHDDVAIRAAEPFSPKPPEPAAAAKWPPTYASGEAGEAPEASGDFAIGIRSVAYATR